MREYAYFPLIHHDSIRILTLQPGNDEEKLQGSMSRIRLSLIPAPGPAVPEAVDLQHTTSPTSIWTWGHRPWAYDAKPKPRVFGSRVFGSHSDREPWFQFYCDRRKYLSTEYDALSYTWGDPAKVEMIAVNGKRLDIARNLHTALLRLRHPRESRRLWIDAICINQGNIQERNHQVRMMQRVYSAASSVIVWLGDPEQVPTSTVDMITDCPFLYQERVFTHGEALLAYGETALNGLSVLFLKAWWRRIWIVQEAVAARELVVHVGHTIFPWAFLRHTCQAIGREEFGKHRLAPTLRSCGYQKFTALDSLRRSKAMPLVHLLRSTQDYQATDPRDKLYALLGMTSDVSAEDLTPDYTKPVHKVFEDLVAFMTVQRQSLDIICSGCFSGKKKRLPSWLPCWKTPAGSRPTSGREGFESTRGSTQAVVDMSQFPRKLIAEGIVIATIKRYGRSVTIGRGYVSTIRGWQDIAALSDEYVKRDFLELIVGPEDNLRGRVTWNYKKLEHFMDGFGQVDSRETQEISDTITRAVMGRRLFVTKKGRMGLGPSGIQPKDKVVMLSGCQVPLVLRPINDYWVLIGEAKVSGLIDDENVQGRKTRRQNRIRMFHLK